MLMTTDAIVYDKRLDGKVALITDGRFSGATSLGHVSDTSRQKPLMAGRLPWWKMVI